MSRATKNSARAKPRVLGSGTFAIASRLSFGVNEPLVEEIELAGSGKKWVEQQFKFKKIKDKKADKVASWFPHLRDSPSTAWAKVDADERTAWDYGFDFACFTLAHKILTRRQVHEVMVDFWSNLLYIPAYEDRSFPWRYDYDRVIRAKALGSYRKLLRATIVHPAMSGWLNNNTNTKNGINENLGRELLELYTVGRPAGYDEDDVKNSARLLTGFKVKVFDGFAASYKPSDHYVGPVSILGFQHANSSSDGRGAVNAYLDYLARHPATAVRIARRLCVRFVSDTPSDSIVNAVAQAYRDSDTAIKPTLRAMIGHPEFKASRRKKIRTPVEDVVNAARVLQMRPKGAASDRSFARQINWMAQGVGQTQFHWPRPDGFPENSMTWGSPARLLRSWNIHFALAGNWWDSTQVAIRPPADSMPKASKWPRDVGQLVDHQSRLLLGTPATSETKQAVSDALDLPLSFEFAQASAVSDWIWTVIRGSVLNSPLGTLR